MKDKIKGKVKDLGKRVVIKVATRIVKHINTNVNIPELEEKFGKDVKKTVQIYISDKDVKLAFRVEDGRIKYIKDPKEIDARAIVDSNTFISLIAGKRKVMDPSTGETRYESYGPYNAYVNGDVEIYGDGVTTDYYMLFKHVWKRVEDDVQDSVGQRIARTLQED